MAAKKSIQAYIKKRLKEGHAKPVQEHFIEITDRLHVINSNIDDHILDHAAMHDPSMWKARGLMIKASKLIGEAYQLTAKNL